MPRFNARREIDNGVNGFLKPRKKKVTDTDVFFGVAIEELKI